MCLSRVYNPMSSSAQRDDSAAKSMYCFSRGPEFDFQLPTACNTHLTGDPKLSSVLQGHWTHMRKHSHVYTQFQR